jgi:hypothetical protein
LEPSAPSVLIFKVVIVPACGRVKFVDALVR